MGKRKEITGKDNGKQKMWIMIPVIIVFFAMAGYAGMSYYYSDRFFRGTTINGINCSGKTSEEAEQAVAKKAEDYLLEVKARNLKSQSINGKLIGYRYVSDGSISQYLDEQKPYKWVRGFWKKQNYTAKENMTYDKVKLKEQLEKHHIRLFAAHLQGRNTYDKEDYQGGTAFLIGNEGKGLTDQASQAADCLIRIPMNGQVESLNAAMAAGILMYEAARQRRG